MADHEAVVAARARSDREVTVESFESFFGREYRRVLGLAFVLCGNRVAAEDLTQEAFLHAFRRWGRIGAYEDPGAWVRRVVANRAVPPFRRLQAETRAVVRVALGHRDPLEVDTEAIALWTEVRRLPARQAQVVALRFYEGRSIEAIARILGCSVNTVKTHLARAKQALARAFGEEVVDDDR
ncbi:MAG: sigma-70 family RNA polymerase sigma factor [Actinomycetes bacterium]|jgi:RNA polymerase sigma-70 factor (ECF subfamily)|nr:MAG: SigE family RNA polymerase sigma factor [Actinomycetota bacterium]